MHHESAKALYDFYPLADKNDFFAAYLYLKHTDHFIYQAGLAMGDPFAAFIADHNPKFRRASQEEAVHVIEQAHERGEVQCAYFKKETGNRLVEICNCCPCCCMGMRVWNLFGGAIPFLAPSGYVSQVNDACDGCGDCAGKACPFGAISLDAQRKKAVVNMARCMGCGVCESRCPIHAISLRREPAKGEPLDVDELKRQGA